MTIALARLNPPARWSKPQPTNPNIAPGPETALETDLLEMSAPATAELARLEEMLISAAAVPFAPLVNPLRAALAANTDRLRARVALAVGAALQVRPEQRLALAAALETLFTASQAHEALPLDGKQEDSRLLGSLVLMGDHLFAQAAVFAAQADLPAIVTLFARTLQTISQTQVQAQFGAASMGDWSNNAVLCAAAAVGAGLLGRLPPAELEGLHEFGLRLGRWGDSRRLDDLHDAQLALRQVHPEDVRQRLRSLL